MTEKPTKKRSRWPAVVAALMLLLPTLYVGSYGPVMAIVMKMPRQWGACGPILTEYDIAVNEFHWPLHWATYTCVPLRGVPDRYLSWCYDCFSPPRATNSNNQPFDPERQFLIKDDQLTMPTEGIKSGLSK